MTFHQVLETCRRTGQPFVDREFPPNAQSLGPKSFGAVVWQRAAQFFGGVCPKLFSEGITVDDIRQGALGDCYFLSALSVLAEVPSRIERMFAGHIENPYGVYCVRMHVGGRLHEVVVDDCFPCDAATLKPIFSRNRGPELWVLLLEKAYAKLHGSYSAIETGSPATALCDLTGSPCFIMKASEIPADELWESICLHDRRDHVMCCSVPAVPNRDLLKELGLVEEHAYALLSAKSFRGNRLLHVRNPWGKGEWKGAWNDDDTAHWTPEAKHALGWVDADDGSFWMSLEDWKRYFDTVTVLSIEDGWSFSSSPAVTLRSSVSVFPVFVEGVASDLYVTVHQPDQSLGVRTCVVSSSFPCTPFGGTKDTFVMSAIVSSDLIRLPPGSFLLIVEVYKDHAGQLPKSVTVSCLSASPHVRIDTRDGAAPNPLPQGLAFMLPSYTQKFGACSYCEGPLMSSHSIIKEKKYHPGCLLCWWCGDSLGSSVFFKEGSLSCKECAAGRKKVSPPAGKVFTERVAHEKRQWESQIKARPTTPPPAASPTASPRPSAPPAPAPAPAVSPRRHKSMDEEVQLRATFAQFDVDRTGSIDAQELEGLLRALRFPISEDAHVKAVQVGEILARIDTDGSRTVDYKEFKAWWGSENWQLLSARVDRQNQAAAYFHAFDPMHCGIVNGQKLHELHDHLTKLGMIQKPFEQFKAEVCDRAGTLTFEAFVKWLDTPR